MIKLIIFDFDGTLFDTKEDIARSVNIYLKELGFEELEEEKIYKFIGNGSDYLLKKSLEEIGKKDFLNYSIVRFLEIYREESTKKVKPFDGIKAILDELKDKTLYIITNKDEESAKMILRKFDMEKYFKKVIGRNTYTLKKPDPSLMEIVLKEENVKRDEVLMVGDSEIDYKFAKEAQVKNIIVLWGGIGEVEKLRELKADFIVNYPNEIVELINENLV
ncbi:MAG: HAD family hydrolase [Caldisericia bacterium]